MKNAITFIACLLTLTAYSQEDACSNALYSANKHYESGRIQSALDVLAPCVKTKSLSGNEMFDATRLMAMCYIYLNKTDSAALFTEKMLQLRPDYQTYHYVDPKELTATLSSYRVENTLDLGLHLGLAFNQVNILKNYSAAETPSTYISQLGLNAGILAEYHFNKNVSGISDPGINSISYLREMDNVAGSKKEYTELITTAELPLIGRYYISKFGLKLYAQAGIQYGLWIRSFADVQSTNLNDGSVLQSSTETSEYRKSSMYGYQAGLGFAKPLGGGQVTMGLRYKSFLPNVVLPERRYDNVNFILSSQYIDSDFSLYSLGWSIGYQLPITYSIKKVK